CASSSAAMSSAPPESDPIVTGRPLARIGAALVASLVVTAIVTAGCGRGQVPHSSSAGAAAGPGTAPIRLTLPQLSGPHQIGSIPLHLVDSNRADPWRTDRKRELMVTVSYPAPPTASGPPAAVFSPAMATAVADYVAAGPLSLPKRSVAWDATTRW